MANPKRRTNRPQARVSPEGDSKDAPSSPARHSTARPLRGRTSQPHIKQLADLARDPSTKTTRPPPADPSSTGSLRPEVLIEELAHDDRTSDDGAVPVDREHQALVPPRLSTTRPKKKDMPDPSVAELIAELMMDLTPSATPKGAPKGATSRAAPPKRPPSTRPGAQARPAGRGGKNRYSKAVVDEVVADRKKDPRSDD